MGSRLYMHDMSDAMEATYRALENIVQLIDVGIQTSTIRECEKNDDSGLGDARKVLDKYRETVQIWRRRNNIA